MRTSRLVLAGLVAGLALAGCGSPASTSSATNANVTGMFAAPGGGVATTYDTNLVPLGSTAVVTSSESRGSTTVTLKVTGLVAGRNYGSHAHVNPCGANGDAAGPHYQYMKDPVSPSNDPMFANPQNEIWLDFTTDASGAGMASVTVPWTFPADSRAEAVIIHEKTTALGPKGEAGKAGTRPACITVDF